MDAVKCISDRSEKFAEEFHRSVGSNSLLQIVNNFFLYYTHRNDMMTKNFTYYSSKFSLVCDLLFLRVTATSKCKFRFSGERAQSYESKKVHLQHGNVDGQLQRNVL